MCNCHSYNADVGTEPEKVLDPNEFFPTNEMKTVCVDACIAEQIKDLWKAGVWTEGCCCGHNGLFGKNPNVIIANEANPDIAIKVLKESDPEREWDILQWQLRKTNQQRISVMSEWINVEEDGLPDLYESFRGNFVGSVDCWVTDGKKIGIGHYEDGWHISYNTSIKDVTHFKEISLTDLPEPPTQQ